MNTENQKQELLKQKQKEEKIKLDKLRKKKELADFKRKYFDLYDDVKISYKEDW